VQVVGFAVELDQFDIEQVARVVVSANVIIAWANTGRWYFVTDSRCVCSSHTLCRARRQ